MRRRALDLEPKVNHERWLVSYSDFVTLLFAFFVVMYSVSQVNEEKYKKLSVTLNEAFSDSSAPKNESVKNNIEKTATLSQLEKKLRDTMEGVPVIGEISLSANENWLELSLSSELLFESGSAQASDGAEEIFKRISQSLGSHENEIQIQGHTDNVPINNEYFTDNWALSSARAIAIVNYFSSQGVEPKRLSAVSLGEHRPIASNDTLEGRMKNRRVVIRVSSKVAESSEIELRPSSGAGAVNLDTSDSTFDKSLGAEDVFDVNEEPAIEPVELESGGLLFSSDPELPRLGVKIKQKVDSDE